MQLGRTMGAVSQSRAVERPARRLQQGTRAAFERMPAGQRLERILRGRDWLGHPLHPLLTDIVTGGLTASATLDILEATGRKELAPAADLVLGVSLAATAPTALAGLADWQHAPERPRRLGLVHATLNVLVSALGVRSLLLRGRGRRTEARAWAFAALAVMNVSAYIGGEMVYDQGMGVELEALEEERGEEPRQDVAAA